MKIVIAQEIHIPEIVNLWIEFSNMKRKKSIFCALMGFFLVWFLSSTNILALDIDQTLRDLEVVIGGYPPNINSKEQLKDVESKYNALKNTLDEKIADDPNNLDLLFKRGYLQSMGHNFDKKGAWKGSETDFLTVLNKDANHIGALVELGMLYVNSDMRLATKAQKLFLKAQNIYGADPLEPAQRGLFFCLYYQGKMDKALIQAEYLKKQYPKKPLYEELYKITKEVIERANREKRDST